ncbi:MAG: adenylate/guanylate cyclase domain-containing protein, partial [Phycisphaerae bacterium]|nr:adenylate/guanylate cyclase domain-containing protein [Phycisphaerae bacterium]
KFLGDGVLAFWSAFGGEPEQCELALRACVECQRQVTEIGKRPDRAALPKVSLRLGVATGVVTIGDCGAPPDLNDYTVIGDAANLAARLESANKQFGTAVLMDGTTYAGVNDPGSLPLLRLGRVVVVGQSVPVEVYTLLVDGQSEAWRALVTKGVQAFEQGDYAACGAAFDELDATHGASKLSAPYRQAMADPEDARDGVLRLRAK